ncbi:MAG: Uma2 family endonuclease, partial [Armatimonadetes bacterium]|nr:Uma2 family endonuclease [Armatimonadota bacterium]
ARYEEARVKEYWIVHPAEKTVMVFSLRSDGQYGKPAVYSHEDEIKVSLFEDLAINLNTVFSL